MSTNLDPETMIAIYKPFKIDFDDKNRRGRIEKRYAEINSVEDFENFMNYINETNSRPKYRQLSRKTKKMIEKQIRENTMPYRTYEQNIYDETIKNYISNFRNDEFGKENVYKYPVIDNNIYNLAYNEAIKQFEEEIKNKKKDLDIQVDLFLNNQYEATNTEGEQINYIDMELYKNMWERRYLIEEILKNLELEDEQQNKGSIYIVLIDGNAIKVNFKDDFQRRRLQDLLDGNLNGDDMDYTSVSGENNGRTFGIEDIVTIERRRPKNLITKTEAEKRRAKIKASTKYTEESKERRKIKTEKEKNKIRTKKNGGFLQYRVKPINEIFEFLKSECDITENLNDDEIKKYILTELIRCQISNDLKDKMFKNNCLAYAVLIATGNQKLYKTIKINSINKRIISSDFINEIGTAFNIKFNVYDVEQEKTFQYPKIFNKPNPIEVNICLYKKHFFINEELKLFRHKQSHSLISSHFLVRNCHTMETFTYYELLQMPFCDENAFSISLCQEKNFYEKDFREYQMKEEYKQYLINYSNQKDLSEEEINNILENRILVFADCEASVGPDYEYFELVNELNEFENQLIENFNINFDKLTRLDEAEIENYTTIENYKKLKNIKETIYYHEAYCISYTINNDYSNIKTHYGKNCLYKFMDDMAELSNKGKLLIYFHNAGYDLNLFNKFNFKNKIQKGNKILSATILYHGKFIEFHDSLALLTMSIKACAGTFCTKENIKKEMFPYKFYNDKNCGNFDDENKWCDIEEINDEIEGPKFISKDLVENCIHLNLLKPKFNDYKSYEKYISEEHYPVLFDSKEYCKFYCEQDVRILAMSFNKLRIMFAEQFKLDITNYISLPAIASALMKANVLTLTNENEKNYEVSGEIQEFIRGAIYGGRCMTSQNKPWITKQNVISLDYVSLYSSAMILLPTIFGTCEVMNEEELKNNNYLNLICGFNEQPNAQKYISGYVVEIVITKINKFKHFPRTTFKTDLGSQYIDFNARLPQKVTLVDIMLEDIMEAHEIEFYTIQGVKYCGKKDFETLPKFIQFLYDKRAALKKVGNPAQIIYKLILNSSYGKLIQKLIEFEIKFVRDRKIKTSKQINKELKPILKEMGYSDLSSYLSANPEDKLLFDDDLLLDCTLEEKKQFCQKFNIDFDEELIEKYKEANAHKILKEYKISEHLYELEERKNKLSQFSDPYLGARILAMSKRIMNKTFVCVEGVEDIMKSLINKQNTINYYHNWLISNNITTSDYFLLNPKFEDIKIEYEEELKQMGYTKEQNPKLFEGDLNNIVFYQDTDSIYMKEKYLPQLKAIYKNLYNQDLYGENQLGRMHIDFEETEINTPFKAKINGKVKPIFDLISDSELKTFEQYQINYKIVQFHDYGELKTDFNNKYFVIPSSIKNFKNCHAIKYSSFETYEKALEYKQRIEETHIETDKETQKHYQVYNINKNSIRANKSIFITKKLYYCQLIDYTSNLKGDHVRSKGIPIEAFEYYVNENYDEDEESRFFKLYKDLLINNKIIKIDLLKTGANIKTEKNIRVSSLKKFERTVKVNEIDYEKLRYKNDAKNKSDEYKLKDIPFRFDEIKGPYFVKSCEYKNETELGIASMVQIENDYKQPGYSENKHEIINYSEFNILTYEEFYKQCYKTINDFDNLETQVLFYMPKSTPIYKQEQIKEKYENIKREYNIKYFYQALRNDEMFKLIVDNNIMRAVKFYQIKSETLEKLKIIPLKDFDSMFNSSFNLGIKNNNENLNDYLLKVIKIKMEKLNNLLSSLGIDFNEFKMVGNYYDILTLKHCDSKILKSIGVENINSYYSLIKHFDEKTLENIYLEYCSFVNFKKYWINCFEMKVSKLRITGRAYNLKHCKSKVLIDIDYHSKKGETLSYEEKMNFIKRFIDFGVGEITLTPNDGLHILLNLENEKLDLKNKEGQNIYRFIDSFKNEFEGWNIDVMFSSDKTSFVHDYESIGFCKLENKEKKYRLIANYENKSFDSFLLKFYECFNCFLIDWKKYKITEIKQIKRTEKKQIFTNLYSIGLKECFIKSLIYNGKEKLNDFEQFKFISYEIHHHQKTDLTSKKLNICSLINYIKNYSIESKKLILRGLLFSKNSKAGPHAKDLIKKIIDNYN